MNDDFLHQLRKDPNAKYLQNLKTSLDRQAERQIKTRRTLLRTAILAALIGGSAVAVAFVAWRGVSHPLAAAANVQNAAGERSEPAKTLLSPESLGLAKEGGGAANQAARESEGGSQTAALPSALVNDAPRPVFTAAGVGAFIVNAEEFVRIPVRFGSMKKPELTQTTATQAFAMLCHVRGSAGADSATADLVGTTRRISSTELAACKRNSVSRIAELRPGYEAAVLVRSRLYGASTLSARDIFLAMAAKVPDIPNRPWAMINNPYRAWNAINPSLSQEQIEIWGPQWSSPTAAVFRETVMEAGCLALQGIAYLREKNPDAFDKLCHSVREDGVYQFFGQVDNKLNSRLDTYPNALALINFKQLAEKTVFVAVSIDGIEATPETIMAGSYRGAQPLYLYVNSAQAFSNHAIYDFILGFERSTLGSSSDTTLVAPDPVQRQAELRNAMTLPELIL